MQSDTILVTGACGQIGSELVLALRKIYPNVIASDLKDPTGDLKDSGIFERLDVLHKPGLDALVKKHKVTQIYHLAAVLSATGEKNPEFAWRVNMKGLRNILDVSVENELRKVFFPSTIAVFGPTTPRINTPQYTVMEPNTIYGISKQAGERWADYYYQKKGLDIRSIRYPGLISYKTKAGGGTTDYAVDIYFEAKEKGSYECFLKEDTTLPMMYMPDAIRGTIMLMEAPAEKITIRSSYRISRQPWFASPTPSPPVRRSPSMATTMSTASPARPSSRKGCVIWAAPLSLASLTAFATVTASTRAPLAN